MKQLIKRPIKWLLAKHKVRMLVIIGLLPVSWVVVRRSGLFDYDWYCRQYQGGRLESLKNRLPLTHYLLFGRRGGLTPSAFFVPEYFDPERWSQAILDPVVKYWIYKNRWGKPTSLFFDGSQHGLGDGVRPPLAQYLQDSSDHQKIVYFDKRFKPATNLTRKQVDAKLVSLLTERSQQLKRAVATEPVKVFDRQLEKQTIDEYKNSSPKNDPLVSIIMPAWNRQELIKPAIESVQAQSYQNWELLITDDGSTDDTAAVVKQYAEDDSRVKLFTPGRGGVSRARNNSIKQAAGQWVAFLDSDNTWTPDFLKTSISMIGAKSSLAGYSAIEMRSHKRTLYRTTPPDPKLLETANYIDLNALVVNKVLLDDIGYFDEDLRRMVDYDLVCRIAAKAEFVYVPIIGVIYTNHDDVARISTTESISWGGVVKSKNFIDWKTDGKNSVSGFTSIILPVRGSVSRSMRCVHNILSTVGERSDIEIIIIDASSTSAVSQTLGALPLINPRIKYHREAACRDTVLAVNYGYRYSRGENIVVVDQNIVVEGDWLQPLIDNIDSETICGPLQLRPQRTIFSAGVDYVDYEDSLRPVHLLQDLPVHTVGDGPWHEVPALSDGCFAIKSELFRDLYGLNPLYEHGFEVLDLSNRAKEKNIKLKVIHASTILHLGEGRGWSAPSRTQLNSDWRGKVKTETSPLWKQAGLAIKGYEPIDSSAGQFGPLRPMLERLDSDTKWWAIKISAPADERRFVWGDMYYGQAIVDALERRGQKATLDFHDHHERPTSYLDDVVLDLRGLDNVKPQARAINIMWVISHPEKVTPEMVRKFDLVYAAGQKWADYMSEKSGKPVQFLPQCTDPNVFFPTKPDPEYKDKVLFVGNSRNVLRPIVRDAIAAGIDVAVYGGGWEGLIDNKYIKGTFIPNDRLAAAYSSARVVLNDHWDDMREWGFISNRIFDVLSAGGCVISDYVEDLHEVVDLDSSLHMYCTHDELTTQVNPPVTYKKQDNHDYIKRHHSFDARARVIDSCINDIISSK